MLIAIPSDAPGGLDAPISEHFGHCAAFTLVRVDDGVVGEVRVIENGGHEQGGCMAPVQVLKELEVEVLLAGGMGMRPLAGFDSVGIAVHHKVDAQTVRQAVDLFSAGKCPAFGKAQTCGGGEGGCGGGHHHHHEPVVREPIVGKADVRSGRVATLSFTLKDAAGEVIDSSESSGNMQYLQGSGTIAALEKALEGKEAGAEVTAPVSPAEAFGERDDARIVEVPRENLPPEVVVGDALEARDPHGRSIHFVVLSLNEESARLDGNHPLVGQEVFIEATIVKVEAATAEEIAHGHIH